MEETSICSITYNSILNPKLRSIEAISNLVLKSEKKNERLKINGNIIFDQKLTKCRQYLEGSTSQIDNLFETILFDNRHSVQNYERRVLKSRTLKSWGMEWRNTPSQKTKAQNSSNVMKNVTGDVDTDLDRVKGPMFDGDCKNGYYKEETIIFDGGVSQKLPGHSRSETESKSK